MPYKAENLKSLNVIINSVKHKNTFLGWKQEKTRAKITFNKMKRRYTRS
ncbi:hypothetical protein HMPREF0766_13821 [Sphingobacterium spiritivorum ATCC 33861]|uniref:Uncharacterized protein n=1 Tax=Sphingobacterium spiritivorum ATCC 33861 TaxID=525373 RepID=D7VS67_SPHSI|nr:hypothetical protein HMPREF0766_13821 [Sphingobacterium spiritivorum ATCC 33861]